MPALPHAALTGGSAQPPVETNKQLGGVRDKEWVEVQRCPAPNSTPATSAVQEQLWSNRDMTGMSKHGVEA